jgi:Secretion system C-terminal sorting domain
MENENESDYSIQFNERFEVNVFPNPASNNITIENESGEISRINIVNALGQQVHSQRYQDTTKISIDVAELPQGIYLVTVTDGENKSVVTRLIKQ